MLIESLDELDKALDEYEIRANNHLMPREKEMVIRIDASGDMIFHSDYRSGNKWAVKVLQNGWGKLKHMYIENNKIISITIKTSSGFLSLKSQPKKHTRISNLVSYPTKN